MLSFYSFCGRICSCQCKMNELGLEKQSFSLRRLNFLLYKFDRCFSIDRVCYCSVLLVLFDLQHHVVSRSQLQLVGVSAMLLASKYEETYAPEIGDFVYITDNSYSKGQIKKMEQLILKTIKYDISNPLCLHFLRRNSKAAVVSDLLLFLFFCSLTVCNRSALLYLWSCFRIHNV